MKIFFTSVLVLNLLLEALAAASLIGGPQGLANIQPETGMWAMNYGFAVIAIASASARFASLRIRALTCGVSAIILPLPRGTDWLVSARLLRDEFRRVLFSV